MLAGWRTVLWYHGRSIMVPYCYQCAPSAQPAILSIANAYTARAFGVSCRDGQVRTPLPTHKDAFGSGRGAHLGTVTDLGCSGGHPACRRAGHLARRNGPPAGTQRPTGRQDAALYGRQDARRYVVAVTSFTPGRDRSEKPLETMGAMMHSCRASGGKSASWLVQNALLSPDVVSECDYSESY
jgi:hypothetical protein